MSTSKLKLEKQAEVITVEIAGVLEEPINPEDNEATIKAKVFYRSCVDIRK